MLATTTFVPRTPIGHAPRAAFSLVELLVASTMSLLLMATVATLFAEFSQSVSSGRAVTELNIRLRNAAWRLRQDFAGLTCVPAALVRVESGEGYFHVIDGAPPTTPTAPIPNLLGDVSDVLAMTTSNPAAPFTGRLAGAKGFESPTTEAVWFCELSGANHKGLPLYNLYRRQILVSASPEAGNFAGNIFAPKGDSDISHNGTHVNGLGDLSKSANRFLPVPVPTPVPNVPVANPPMMWPASWKLTGSRAGEDVLLTNVVSFDVKLVLSTATVANDQTFETREDGDPAAAPLRGIAVRIRAIDPSTGQIRELKVVHSFPPR